MAKKGDKMGYYTWYSVSVKEGTPIEKEREAAIKLTEIIGYFDEERAHIAESEYPFEYLSYDSMKWYDWERDMTNLSKQFPEIEFIVYGEGEDRDDTWRAFIKNGACIYQKAHIYYDPEPIF